MLVSGKLFLVTAEEFSWQFYPASKLKIKLWGKEILEVFEVLYVMKKKSSQTKTINKLTSYMHNMRAGTDHTKSSSYFCS